MGVKGAQAVCLVWGEFVELNSIKPWILADWSAEEGYGTPCVAVKCVDIWKNTGGEGGNLVCN